MRKRAVHCNEQDYRIFVSFIGQLLQPAGIYGALLIKPLFDGLPFMDVSEVAEMMQKRFALKTILKGYKHCISSLGRLRWPRRCKQMQQNIII